MLDLSSSKAAATPLGSNQRKPSIVGFDPLMAPANGSEGNKGCRQGVHGIVVPLDDVPQLVPSQSSGSSVSGHQHKRNITPDQLVDELRVLASEIGKMSPTLSASSPEASPQPSPASSSSSKAKNKLNVTLPWHKKKSKFGNSTPSKITTPVPSLGKIDNSQTPPTTGSSGTSSTFSSPMMQELWYTSSEAAMNDLSVPSLSKPRATSFLTGKEPGVRTSEQNPTRWQIDIPNKLDFDVSVRTCRFLDSYQSEECLLNLGDLIPFSRKELSEFAKGNASSLDGKVADCHRSIVEALLECGDDIVQVRGHYMSPPPSGTTNPKDRRELLVLERQNNQLLVVFRGTSVEQLSKPGTGIVSGASARLQQGGGAVEVLKLYEETMVNDGLGNATFEILDRLTDENPFCDIAFTGFAYGAALASYAAYRYAYMRSYIRVQLMGYATPRIGFESLRMSAHSLPNLKPIRIQIENNNSITLSSQSYSVKTSNCSSNSGAGRPCYFGHLIRINTSLLPPSISSSNPAIRAYKFGLVVTPQPTTEPKKPKSLPSLPIAVSKCHMKPVLKLLKSAKASVVGGNGGLTEQFVYGNTSGAGTKVLDYAAAMECTGETEWVRFYENNFQ